LGVWVLGTNSSQTTGSVLDNAANVLANADTNLTALFEKVGSSLDHLADLTSNLNAQVQSNTNILGTISKAVTDTDDLVEGLKRHWLLRSAFKTPKTNAPAVLKNTSPRMTSPRDPAAR
jgi:ABC-type transporter Mla subunit MlaD